MKEIEMLRENFRRAYSGTSFSPELRADQDVRAFSEGLSEDLAELGDKAGDYAEKYVSHLKRWAECKSRCMSPMITGPAKFPVERNRKAFNAEQRAWDDFMQWRTRYIKRAHRVHTKSPEEEIDDALIRLEKEKNNHALMIGINKVLRKKIDAVEKRRILLEDFELSEKVINNILTPDCMGGIGFQPFMLTNSNARIKNLEQKLQVMRARINRRDTFEPIMFPGGSITIADDRVVISHDEKPPAAIIDALKSHGFRWSPSRTAWVRKHTGNAIAAAREVCGVK